VASAALLPACGGATTTAATDAAITADAVADAAISDAVMEDVASDLPSIDAAVNDVATELPMCPTPGSMLADVNVYLCEAAAPGTPGCQAEPGDPSAVYPEGCQVLLTTAGYYCGPIGCTCSPGSPFADGGLSFLCPL
jgi:hypothetical protein